MDGGAIQFCFHVLCKNTVFQSMRWSSWSCILAAFSRQSRTPNFCYLYPEYCFLSKDRIPLSDFREPRFPSSSKIPHLVKKFCIFPNLTIFRSNPGSWNILSDPDTHVLVPYKALLPGIVKWQEHLCVICCIAHYKFDVCINTVCCIICNFFLWRFNSWLKEKNMLGSI